MDHRLFRQDSDAKNDLGCDMPQIAWDSAHRSIESETTVYSPSPGVISYAALFIRLS
jgi:hypothetical protein